MHTRKSWIIVSVCVLVMILLTAGLFLGRTANNAGALRITLEGEREITVEYGETYIDPGASAQFFKTSQQTEPVNVAVSISSDVDDRTVGSYLVKYTAVHEGVTGTAYRRVHIVDTQAPVITLAADPEKFTFPNETYIEEGYSAQDNYDGDITALVQRTETKERITYTVSDSSGNTASIERYIAYNDPIAPELTLKGEANMLISAGQAFTDPGYTAVDNCDGDITGKVVISGGVDIYLPGTYTITYTVTDAYQNTTTASRTVNVVSYLVNNPTKPSDKVIYLTFDDGPGEYTPELLDILKKYNVKATFFVVNTKYINTIKRASDEGHAIGIHSTTHRFNEVYASEEAFFNDLYTMRDIIRNITGQTTTLMRFPGGSSNTISSFNPGIMTRLTKAVVDAGFQYFDWNVDSNDAGGAKTDNQVFRNVINGIGDKKAAVVLQHDIKRYSIDAVERIINWGLKNGYTFLPLTPDSPGCHHGVNN